MVRPIVTPAEMAAIDAEAPEGVDELIDRAGWATARAALELLDRPYGSRVAVLAGPGNNGADGRRAVPHLQRRGVHCTVFDITAESGVGAGEAGRRPASFDLVIDACYGTGLTRPFDPSTLPIDVGPTPVLAVDIPSGVDGTTGQVLGGARPATATVTFAALKPGLVLHPGRGLVGRLSVADIGLDCSRATMSEIEASDLVAWPRAQPDDHKWRRAVAVIGGGPGMTGAPGLAALAALRAGAGYATMSIPGAADEEIAAVGPTEVVGSPIGVAWADELSARLDRFSSAVVGPGLPANETNRQQVASWWARSPVPTVFDAGAITALAEAGAGAETPPTPVTHVVTPHDGEYTRLAGQVPGPDRVAAARALARRLDAVVLLKGPTTVVAEPTGSVLVSTAGDQRLATAGTGDVLAGLVAAGLAGGLDPFIAAGLGAELHGRAAGLGPAVGLLASDLPVLVAEFLSSIAAG